MLGFRQNHCEGLSAQQHASGPAFPSRDQCATCEEHMWGTYKEAPLEDIPVSEDER